MNFELCENQFLKLSFSESETLTVQDFYDRFIPSKKIQHLCIQNGWITLDGKKVKRETGLQGKELIINLYPEKQNYPKLENDEVRIVYEDPFVIVAFKPAGIIVHDDGNNSETLLGKVRSHYSEMPYTINQIQRLDRETSGLILFTKSPVFEPWLNLQLEERSIHRKYLAISRGKAEPGKTFTIKKDISRDRHDSRKMIVSKNGQKASTFVEVLASDGKYSAFRCTLQTGRTHQIRVHLSSNGYPILNDELYGIRSDLCTNMALCAYRLEFYQPFDDKQIKLEITPPKDIDRLIKKIKKASLTD